MRSISEMMDLSGRSVLVTGGAGHIGRAICHGLAELGATISVLDIESGSSEDLVADLSAISNSKGLSVACDLRDELATRKAVRKVSRQVGALDILVHCAAFVGTTEFPGWSVRFQEQTVEAWDAALRVNLTSAFVITQEMYPVLSRSGKGSVILFGSTYGIVGPDMNLYEDTAMANPAGYAASKGGLIQLMRHLSTILAPHVRVNAVSPGGVWRDQPEEFHKKYISRTPLGRMAREEDLVGAVAYLASDLSQYVTGHNLVVDGGWTAW